MQTKPICAMIRIELRFTAAGGVNDLKRGNRMESCTVWYDEWQMACCGEPFAPGSRVCWPVVEHWEWPLLPEELKARLGKWDYDFDSHGCDEEKIYYTLQGTVEKIQGVYLFYRRDEKRNALIPSGGLVIPVPSVHDAPSRCQGARLDAYFVRLSHPEVRPFQADEAHGNETKGVML